MTGIINTRFLVISDTHGLDLQEGSEHPFRLPLPRVDVLLHCGDLTQCGGQVPFKKALNMLGQVDAELKLIIAGNHDLDLDRNYCVANDEEEDFDAAINLMKGQLAKEAGVIHLEEGTHLFTLKNGATFSTYASPFTPAFGDWAFMYEPQEDRFNSLDASSPVKAGVDIMMTHGPPHGILDESEHGNLGCDMLLQAVQRVKPKMHCFGHIHEGHGARINNWNVAEKTKDLPSNTEDIKAQRYAHADATNLRIGQETLMVNAAIRNDGDEPCNAPWVVDLPLEPA